MTHFKFRFTAAECADDCDRAPSRSRISEGEHTGDGGMFIQHIYSCIYMISLSTSPTYYLLPVSSSTAVFPYSIGYVFFTFHYLFFLLVYMCVSSVVGLELAHFPLAARQAPLVLLNREDRRHRCGLFSTIYFLFATYASARCFQFFCVYFFNRFFPDCSSVKGVCLSFLEFDFRPRSLYQSLWLFYTLTIFQYGFQWSVNSKLSMFTRNLQPHQTRSVFSGGLTDNPSEI